MTRRQKSRWTLVASLALTFATSAGTAVWKSVEARMLRQDVAEKAERQTDNAAVFFALLKRTQAERQAARTCLELDTVQARRACLVTAFRQ